jgi:diphthine methyl ester synthase
MFTAPSDIKVKEPDFEAMTRGRTAFLPPRFMTVNTALQQLLTVAENRKDGGLSQSLSRLLLQRFTA